MKKIDKMERRYITFILTYEQLVYLSTNMAKLNDFFKHKIIIQADLDFPTRNITYIAFWKMAPCLPEGQKATPCEVIYTEGQGLSLKEITEVKGESKWKETRTNRLRLMLKDASWII